MTESRITFLVIVVTAFLTQSALAFDGQRKGFVLSLGGGVTPAAHWSYEPVDYASETEPGIAWQSLVGWGVSSQNILGFQGTASWCRSDYMTEGVLHTFFGLTWHHYISSKARSPFCVLGVGGSLLGMSVPSGDLRDKYGISAEGFGALLGGGLEFTNHWQLAGHISGGVAQQNHFVDSKESSSEGERFRTLRVSLLLSYVAY